MKAKHILFLFLFFSCSSYAKQPDNSTLVSQVLDSFHAAASVADGAVYFSLMTEDATFIGTDATETWTMEEFKAFAEPYFSQGRGWTYTPKERQIRFSKDRKVAWFVELLDQAKYGECRGTGVLELTDNGWLIKQYHLTIPIPNDLAGEVTEKIRAFQAAEDK